MLRVGFFTVSDLSVAFVDTGSDILSPSGQVHQTSEDPNGSRENGKTAYLRAAGQVRPEREGVARALHAYFVRSIILERIISIK